MVLNGRTHDTMLICGSYGLLMANFKVNFDSDERLRSQNAPECSSANAIFQIFLVLRPNHCPPTSINPANNKIVYFWCKIFFPRQSLTPLFKMKTEKIKVDFLKITSESISAQGFHLFSKKIFQEFAPRPPWVGCAGVGL